MSARAVLIAVTLACTNEPRCEPWQTCGETTTRLCRGEEIPVWLYDADHCGTGSDCRICPAPGLPHSVPACDAETAKCVMGCERDRADCNGIAADGCETSVLIDAQNCGACGIRCHGRCVEGICDHRYENEGEVSALAGGLTITTHPLVNRIFWARMDGGVAEVRAAVLDGTEPFSVASVAAPPGASASLALDNAINPTTLYWAVSPPGDVYAVSVGGGPLVTIATGQGAASHLICRGSALYWSNTQRGEVAAFTAADGRIRVIATGQKRPGAIEADSDRVYWLEEGFDGGDGAVHAAPLDGGPAEIISADALIADGGTVPTGQAPRALARVYEFASDFPQSQPIVVWADVASGALWQWIGYPPVLRISQPLIGPWDPVEMWGGLESFRIFNRANAELVDSGIFIPGKPPYAGPFFLSGGRQFPAGTRLVSPQPVQGTWTDGQTVGSNFALRGY